MTDKQRNEWLAKRLTAVGASEVAALFNVHPYLTRLGLWARKTHRLPETEETRLMRLGTKLEGVVAEEYQIDTGRNVQQPDPPWLRMRDVPLACTPDRLIHDVPDRPNHPAPLQIKTTNAHKAHAWDDGPPLWIQMQCQAEMLVLGSSWGSYAVLIGGADFKWGDLERHEDFCEVLCEKANEFWSYVVTDQPPPETTPDDWEILHDLYPHETPAKTIELPRSALALTADYQGAQAELSALQERIKLRKAEIARLMGDAERAVLPDGTAWQWKTKRGYHVDSYDVAEKRELRRIY